MGLTKDDAVEDFERPRLQVVPLRAGASTAGVGTTAAPSGGYSSALVWRFSMRVAGDPGLWVAQVDAHSGAIRSFVDDTKYAQAQRRRVPTSRMIRSVPTAASMPNYPMPFATVNIGASQLVTTSTGTFTCSHLPGPPPRRTLIGPYVTISDRSAAQSSSR